MHTIFRVPELWSYILTPDLDKSALNAAARTCHALKEPALDALWRNLNSIEPLLLLLGEIQYGPDTVTQSYRVRESCSTEDVWQFVEPRIPSKNWAKFFKYSWRVRTLQLYTHTEMDANNELEVLPIGKSVFAAIAFTLPHSLRHLPLLPSLKSLSVFIGQECDPIVSSSLLMFLNDGLERLSIEFQDDTQSRTIRYLLREIPSRSRCLKSVKIVSEDFDEYTSNGDPQLDDDVQEFVREMKLMEEIVVSRYWLTPINLQLLGQSSRLRRISAHRGYHYRIEDVPQIDMAGYPMLAPNLTSLALTVTNIRSIYCLTTSQPLMLPKLEKLEIDTNITTAVAGNQLKEFLSALAEARPGITSLHLSLAPPKTVTAFRISFDLFAPLFTCKNMTSFVIHHPCPLLMDLQDLHNLLEQWPKLTELILSANPDTSSSTSSGLRLEALHVVARCNPHIRRLGLYLDCSPQEPSTELHQLSDLEFLHVGSSKVYDSHAMAALLADLCKVDLEIIEGDPDGRQPADAFLRLPIGQRAAWRDVQRLFQTLAKMKEKERRRAMDLQWEHDSKLRHLEKRLAEEVERRRVVEVEICALKS